MDYTLFNAINSLAIVHVWLQPIAVFFAEPFAYVFLAFFALAVLLSKKEWFEKLFFLVYSGAVFVFIYLVAVTAIRAVIHRPRPFISHHVLQLVPESGYSFPSRHATLFFALALLMYSYNKKAGILFFIGAILIGIGRVMVGVHYPGDILGGACIGMALAYASLYFYGNIQKKVEARFVN